MFLFLNVADAGTLYSYLRWDYVVQFVLAYVDFISESNKIAENMGNVII